MKHKLFYFVTSPRAASEKKQKQEIIKDNQKNFCSFSRFSTVALGKKSEIKKKKFLQMCLLINLID